MSHEIEVLDQLLGGDLPLHVIADLFPELAHCRRALAAMLNSGEILLIDPEGRPIEPWRFRELENEPDAWKSGSGYRVDITDQGVQHVSNERKISVGGSGVIG